MMATARKTADGSWDAGPRDGALPTPEEWAQSQRDWQWFHENRESLQEHPELNKADDPKGLAVREFVTAKEPLWMLGH